MRCRFCSAKQELNVDSGRNAWINTNDDHDNNHDRNARAYNARVPVVVLFYDAIRMSVIFKFLICIYLFSRSFIQIEL